MGVVGCFARYEYFVALLLLFGCKASDARELSEPASSKVQASEGSPKSGADALPSPNPRHGGTENVKVQNEPQKKAADTHAPSPSVASSVRASQEKPSTCLALCKIGDELNCGSSFSTCLQDCQQMLQLPNCSAEMGHAMDCFAGQPRAGWSCDAETGMPMLNEGPCDDEQRAVVECMARSGRPPSAKGIE